MSRRLHGACLALVWVTALLGAACSDDGSPVVEPVLPSLHLTFDEDRPIVIHPLDGVKAPQGRPLAIIGAYAEGRPVTIEENGRSLELSPEPNFTGRSSSRTW